eukprot:6189647-Pleurochrysis_carterae.AAC.4
MLAVGTADGHVQLFDPRQQRRLGACDVLNAVSKSENIEPEMASREVTALRFDPRGLGLAVGTSTGHVALYDIRRAAPIAMKDHGYAKSHARSSY